MLQIERFYQYLNCICYIEKYNLCDLANKEQTPPHFILDEHKMYGYQGSRDVCCNMTAPDLEESRSIAQITLFTDDVPRAKPLIIFKEKSFEICDH